MYSSLTCSPCKHAKVHLNELANSDFYRIFGNKVEIEIKYSGGNTTKDYLNKTYNIRAIPSLEMQMITNDKTIKHITQNPTLSDVLQIFNLYVNQTDVFDPVETNDIIEKIFIKNDIIDLLDSDSDDVF